MSTYNISSNKGILERLKMTLSSFLTTQDLDHTKLNLWIYYETNKSKLAIQFEKVYKYYFRMGLMEFKVLDLNELCSNGVYKTYYDSCVNLKNVQISDSTGYSDILRFLLLYNYGGDLLRCR